MGTGLPFRRVPPHGEGGWSRPPIEPRVVWAKRRSKASGDRSGKSGISVAALTSAAAGGKGRDCTSLNKGNRIALAPFAGLALQPMPAGITPSDGGGNGQVTS